MTNNYELTVSSYGNNCNQTYHDDHFEIYINIESLCFPGGLEGKASACNAGDPGSILVFGRSPGEENGNPLQSSCLENPMDGGASQATVHGVAKSRTGLSDNTCDGKGKLKFTDISQLFLGSL